MTAREQPPTYPGSYPHSRGFTLIEVLVAMAIFAVVGLIANQLLSRTLDNHKVLRERGDEFAELQRGMQILQRDIMQIHARPIRDAFGDPAPALVIGSDGVAEFSRIGWRNPLNHPRSEVQRVGYLVEDGALMRMYWLVLDRAQDSEPIRQKLLDNVERAEFFALDAAGNEHTFWPRTDLDPADPSQQLIAVILRLETNRYGNIERIWEVPSV